jgi:hypothetical protein
VPPLRLVPDFSARALKFRPRGLRRPHHVRHYPDVPAHIGGPIVDRHDSIGSKAMEPIPFEEAYAFIRKNREKFGSAEFKAGRTNDVKLWELSQQPVRKRIIKEGVDIPPETLWLYETCPPAQDGACARIHI